MQASDQAAGSVYPPTYGLVLAGGQARRMGGGDKPLLKLGPVTILDRVLGTLAGQCCGVVLSANGAAERFARFKIPVVADDMPGFAGPLAGLVAGLDWVATYASGVEWVVSAPGDSPFLPQDLVARLHVGRRAEGATLAYARSGDRRHPVIGLWPVRLRAELRSAVMREGVRKVEAWTARYHVALVDWPVTPVDPFFNINVPHDVLVAGRLAEQAQAGPPASSNPPPEEE